MDDLVASFKTIKEAQQYVRKLSLTPPSSTMAENLTRKNLFQIVDRKTLQVAMKGEIHFGQRDWKDRSKWVRKPKIVWERKS